MVSLVRAQDVPGRGGHQRRNHLADLWQSPADWTRAARWNRGGPVAIRVSRHGLDAAVGVRDDHKHICQVRLACVLCSVAIDIDVQVARDRRRQVVAIIRIISHCWKDDFKLPQP